MYILYTLSQKYHYKWGKLSQGSQIGSWLMVPVHTCSMEVRIQGPEFS